MTFYPATSVATDDFKKFLAEVGLSEDSLAGVDVEWSKAPPGSPYVVDKSPIAGQGVFLTQDFSVGDVITLLIEGGVWTEAGRFMNHHPHPNVKPLNSSKGLCVVAITNLAKGQELLLNYRDMRAALYEKQVHRSR